MCFISVHCLVCTLVYTLSGVYVLWCVVFQCFCLVTIFVPLEEIGQKTWTSLNLKLNHFRDFWTCLEGKINHLLQEQWPTPNVGWPEEGTFDPPTIHRVKKEGYGPSGHLAQAPYITT